MPKIRSMSAGRAGAILYNSKTYRRFSEKKNAEHSR